MIILSLKRDTNSCVVVDHATPKAMTAVIVKEVHFEDNSAPEVAT